MSTLVRERVDALIKRCQSEVDAGRIPGAQLAVGLNGEIVINEAFGDARRDQRFHTYSAIKPTVSLTVLLLAHEGRLDLNEPVAAVLGSFGTHGKEQITVSQVLLHSGGFPYAPLTEAAHLDRAARLECYANWRTTWAPGTAFEYHPASAHWVLADLITEVTGRHYVDEITDRVMTPAGQPAWLGIAESDQGDVVTVEAVGSPPDPDEFRARFGFDLPDFGISTEMLLAFNEPSVRAMAHPGGGGIAGAAQVASWYQAILNDDSTILPPEVRTDALQTVRQKHPDLLGVPANRTHAFVLAGDPNKADPNKAAARGFGYTVGPRAFGHNGAKGQRVWADPDSGLSFAFMTRGLEQNDLVHEHWGTAISSLAGNLTTPIG